MNRSVAPGAQRWTFATALVRAVQVAREEGVRSLWFKALGETIYRRLAIVVLDLQRPPPIADAALALDFGFLDESDAPALAALGTHPGPVEALERLRHGERCFVARHEDRIVSARWLTTGSGPIAYLDRSLPLEPGEVYAYETFTHPDYRGLGISAAAGTRLAHTLAAEGARRIVGAVLPESRGGVRAYQKAGYRRVGVVGWVQLGRRRRHFSRRIRPRAAARRPGRRRNRWRPGRARRRCGEARRSSSR